MTPTEDAASQLEDVIAERMWPVEAAIGPRPEFDAIRGYAADAARMMVAQLRSGDEKLAAQTAIDIASLLPGEIEDEWWQTALGKLIAQSVGWPGREAMTLSDAALVLGVSRQRVQALAREGKLDRHPDGGITSTSVAMRARES